MPASHYQLGYLNDSNDAAHFVDTDVECHVGKQKLLSVYKKNSFEPCLENDQMVINSDFSRYVNCSKW